MYTWIILFDNSNDDAEEIIKLGLVRHILGRALQTLNTI
jgi:hypothetical protein